MSITCAECPALSVCEQQFTTRILTDIIGVECPDKVCEIVAKLCVSATVYDQTKSRTTLSIIANDLYDCLRPTANDIARITSDELSKTFIYILIVTAIFIVLMTIILVTIDSTVYYWWIIVIAIIFGLLYVGLVFFISYMAKMTISTNITNSQNAATRCVNTAITALTNYENDQQTALSNALCAYTDDPVSCLT